MQQRILTILNPKKFLYGLRNMIRDVYLGSGLFTSRIAENVKQTLKKFNFGLQFRSLLGWRYKYR
jgi:hypothetical protein